MYWPKCSFCNVPTQAANGRNETGNGVSSKDGIAYLKDQPSGKWSDAVLALSAANNKQKGATIEPEHVPVISLLTHVYVVK